MEPTEHTYEDAGRLCGVSAETIRHRAKRGKLRRGRPTNTGRPTVLLTEQDIAAISAGRPTVVQPGVQPPGPPGGQPPAEYLTIRALEGEASALREALDRERARVDRAEASIVQQQAKLEGVEAELTTARAKVEAEVAQRLEAHEALGEAVDRLTAALDAAAADRRELDSLKAGNRLTRALRAFRGRSKS